MKVPSTGARPAAGAGGAANFLNNSPASRPGTADRAGNVGDRTDNRSDRTDNRGDRTDNRSDNRSNRQDNRPDRVENRGERTENRSSRRDEVRNQFHDHHPRHDFWKDNPNWARWRLNRPYRWATYAAVSGFFNWGSEPVYYEYGDNIYYEGDQVYYGDEAVASTEEYAQQAQTIAESAPPLDEASEWMSLGLFAITQDDEASGPPPTLFIQLVINKQGLIAGTFTNDATDKSDAVEGMIDTKTQRSAWTIEGKQWPVMETGISNLTKDTAPVLVHFEDGQTQQMLLVRMDEPEEGAAAQ
ncbi:MAG: hypothetical protein COA78_05400 [Blastopirellula sp.]|nr:MAG: hypothetical protein COA78_05400 [Blastopirellula sp.]